MPIKKENLARYPRDWKEISASVRHESGQCCEFCSVPNYAVGLRNQNREFIAHHRHSLRHATHAQAKTLAKHLQDTDGQKRVVIVLTVAHLDHTPENCARENLKALCQMCHLLYDIEHHANTRRQSKNKYQMEIGYV